MGELRSFMSNVCQNEKNIIILLLLLVFTRDLLKRIDFDLKYFSVYRFIECCLR